MPRDASDDDGDRGGGGALSLMATTETQNSKLFHTFPSNVDVDVDVGQVAELPRASPRREVARAQRRLEGLVHDAHDPLDRPMRAPGAPHGVICALRP